MRQQRKEWLNRGKIKNPFLYDGAKKGEAEPPVPTRRPVDTELPKLNKFERERRAKAYEQIKRMKNK
jgi:hypothetical protein